LINFQTILNAVAWSFLLVPVVFMILTTLMTVAALLPSASRVADSHRRRLAVIIPAHNESLLIEDTVKAVVNQDYPKDKYCVMVVADNCSDDTASLAAAAGARILERDKDPGKGQGLKDALGVLLDESWDGFLIVDADSLLDVNGLTEINHLLANGRQVFQLRYGIRNPTESLRTRLFELSMASFNALRPLGRTRMGISAGISGNGFGFSRQVANEVPYLAHSIVEDLEYHMHVLRHHYRVYFSDKAAVLAQMPIASKESETQRVRWERGRVITIQSYGKEMIKSALRGDRYALEALIDLFNPPVSLVVLATVAGMLIGGQVAEVAGLVVLLMLGFHYVVAVAKFGSILGAVRVALYVPWYLVWKTWIVVRSLIVEKSLAWNRTDRH
jgi:1,2-diacylglycerol 3-beta-glucosyltransferase